MHIFCEYCGNEISRSPAHIGKNNFCSRNCYTLAKRADKTLHPNYNGGHIVKCAQCCEDVYKNPSALLKSINSFCSRKCLQKWNSIHRVGENAIGYKNALHTKICTICNKEFTTYLEEQLTCSLICGNKAKEKKKVLLSCTNCSEDYEVIPSAVYWANKRGQINNFCSKTCVYNYYKGENHSNWISDRTQLKDQNKSIRWSKQMVDWRKNVYVRDNYTCQICDNRSTKNSAVVLNAHHVVRFSEDECLRFDINNGITLCEDCHKLTYGKEQDFEEQFKGKIKDKEKL